MGSAGCDVGGRVCGFEWRYGSGELRRLLSVESIIGAWKRVELAILEALAEIGVASWEAVEEAREAAGAVSACDVYGEEGRTGHEVASLAFLLGERGGGEAARWVHFGATSNDIIDTGWALVLRDALGVILGKLWRIIERMAGLAREHRYTVMPGRTHAQHATPVTFGFKLANYVYELSRSYERLCQAAHRVLRVKMGGATGTMAGWEGYGLEVRRRVAEKLGLPYHPISTQVAPRDGFAELAADLAILASQLDRFAVEVRELARPEIGEVWEERGGAIGSSAMPQKTNPVTAERVGGMARLARSLALGFLENIVLWHERDLTNSSFERIALPHLLLAVDQALEDTLALLDRLRVDPERMRRNLHLTMDTAATEKLLNMLVEAGLPRRKAYQLARTAARKALAEGKPLWRAAAEVEEIAKLIPPKKLREQLNPENYIGHAPQLVDEAIAYAEKTIGECNRKLAELGVKPVKSPEKQ